MYADFFISNKNIFEEEAVIYQHWVNGQSNIYEDVNAVDIRGNYQMTIDNKNYKVIINGELTKPTGSIKVDTAKHKLNISLKNNLATLNFEYDSAKVARLSGNYDEVKKGIEDYALVSKLIEEAIFKQSKINSNENLIKV